MAVLELQTNLHEGFTITEKSPTRAFSWIESAYLLLVVVTLKCEVA